MPWPRTAAGSRGWEHVIVYAIAVVWGLGVLGPTLISLLLSLLGARGVHIRWSATLDAYRDILESGRWEVVLRTMGLAAFVSLICLACGFPFALWLAKRARPARLIQIIWMSLTIPFFLDPSARTIVWRTVLGTTGLVNTVLQRLHLTHAPIEWLLFSDFSVYLGLIGPYFPNMVMPIYLSILLIDDELLHASADLGASPWATLRRIVIPLAMPGIVAGVIFTFVPVMGDSVVPNILGGGNREYLADAVMSLSTSMNYSGAAALATIIVTMAAILVPLFWLARQRAAVRVGVRGAS
jgi:ABC-type spermidine/putrescine transport system permease subunit I